VKQTGRPGRKWTRVERRKKTKKKRGEKRSILLLFLSGSDLRKYEKEILKTGKRTKKGVRAKRGKGPGTHEKNKGTHKDPTGIYGQQKKRWRERENPG